MITYVALKAYLVRIMSLTSHRGLFSVRYSRLIVALWWLQSAFVAHLDLWHLAPRGTWMPLRSWGSPVHGEDAPSTLAFPRMFHSRTL